MLYRLWLSRHFTTMSNFKLAWWNAKQMFWIYLTIRYVMHNCSGEVHTKIFRNLFSTLWPCTCINFCSKCCGETKYFEWRRTVSICIKWLKIKMKNYFIPCTCILYNFNKWLSLWHFEQLLRGPLSSSYEVEKQPVCLKCYHIWYCISYCRYLFYIYYTFGQAHLANQLYIWALTAMTTSIQHKQIFRYKI